MSEQGNTSRDRLIEAAKVLFGQFGFRKTSVDEIAERAGLSKATMYKVFRSKEELLAELVMSEARALRRYCMEQIKELDDPLDRVETLCNLANNYFTENPFLGRVMADDERLFSPFLGNQVRLIEEGLREIIIRLLDEGMATGAFRKMDVVDAADSIVVLMRAFAYHPTDDANSEWIAFILRAVQQNRKPDLGDKPSAGLV